MPVSTDQALPRQPRRGLGASTTLAAGNQPAAGGTLRQIVAPGWEPVVAELVSRLRGGGLADEGPRGAFIVKQGQHRTVYRLAIAGQSLIVKHYPCSHWRGRLKHLVRGSTARREWHKTLAAAERGIDTIELVACLEQYTWGLCGDSYLVSRELPAAQPLDLYLAELAQRETLPHQPSDRRRIIDQLARFTAAVHRAGILHDDFHAGNILWQQNEQAAAPSRLVLIDLPGARLGAPLDWRHTRRGLAMLATSLGGIAQGTDIIRFFMYYLRERPDLRLDHRAGLLQLEQHTRSHAQRILRGRDGRSLRTNRDFRAIKSKAGRAHAIHDFPTSHIAQLLEDPDRPLRDFRHAPVKLSRTSMVMAAELPAETGNIRVAFKRSRNAIWWKAMLGRFRRSRAVEAFRRGHALLQRGIATPRPLLALESACASRSGDSHLAVEWIDGAENLHLFGWRLAELAPSHRRRLTRQAAASLGRLVGRMHNQQVAHRDLKGTNLIFVEQPGGVDALIVDLDGMSICRRLTPEERAANLARLAVAVAAHPWVSRTDHLRLLTAYLQQLPADQRHLKQLWKKVAARTQPVRNRLHQQGKPLA